MVLMFMFVFFATLLSFSSAFSRKQLLAAELKFRTQKTKKHSLQLSTEKLVSLPRHQTAIFSHGTPDKAMQEAFKFQKRAMLTAFAALEMFSLHPTTVKADSSALFSPASISVPVLNGGLSSQNAPSAKNIPSSASASFFSQNTMGPPASSMFTAVPQSSDSQVTVNLPKGFRESIAKSASNIPGEEMF